jgi:hypothetical protein
MYHQLTTQRQNPHRGDSQRALPPAQGSDVGDVDASDLTRFAQKTQSLLELIATKVHVSVGVVVVNAETFKIEVDAAKGEGARLPKEQGECGTRRGKSEL